MSVVYLAAGLSALILLAVDVLWTSFGEGGGPLARGLTRAVWRPLLRRAGGRRAVGSAGFAIVLLSVTGWLAILWGGWYLVLEGAGAAVYDPISGTIASPAARLHLAGYAIFGLGDGPFELRGGWWLAGPLAASSGLFVAVLSLTYLVPVMRAVAHRRWFAALVSGLGASPQEILLRAWSGIGFDGLEHHLPALARELATIQQRHRAYPVLHAFHAGGVEEAAAVQIARLDEALTLLELGVDTHLEPESIGAAPVRELVSNLLRSVRSDLLIDPETPPPPGLALLRARGVPVIADDAFAWRVEALSERRRLLRAFVETNGWSWDEVTGAGVHPAAGSGPRFSGSRRTAG